MPHYAGSQRFGNASPSRIAGSAMLLQESDELLPGEPMYQALIPFYPGTVPSTGVISGVTGTSLPFVEEDDRRVWQAYPACCDLIMWQGDDVIVTMYFRDLTDPSLDMSDFTWTGQIRQSRTYASALLADMPCSATFIPPADDDSFGVTKVEMFLPRQSNLYAGCFYWELRSANDTDLSRFPAPPGITTWPPATLLRTWLFGNCLILPRVSDTDYLPGVAPTPPPTPGGYSMVPFAGPNGRVP